jgi:hypothetical protein
LQLHMGIKIVLFGEMSSGLMKQKNKTVCGQKRPTNLTQLYPFCQEEWANIHPTYRGKLVEGSPKRSTQVKQIKKATLPNTNWMYVNFWPTGNVMKEIKSWNK